MKSFPLRQLVREPLKIKRWTRAGQPVQITDNGRPLWIVRPATPDVSTPESQETVDEILDETLGSPQSSISAVEALEDSRR